MDSGLGTEQVRGRCGGEYDIFLTKNINNLDKNRYLSKFMLNL